MNLRQKMAVVAIDVLILSELAFCIYLSSRDLDGMVLTFLWTYIPAVLGTILLGRIWVRRLQ